MSEIELSRGIQDQEEQLPKKRRGRPPRNAAQQQSAPVQQPQPMKKRRNRPSKYVARLLAQEKQQAMAQQSQPKRRGRPPRNAAQQQAMAQQSQPKRRGRPPRNAAQQQAMAQPLPKRRGRPPRNAAQQQSAPVQQPQPLKKRRGRPSRLGNVAQQQAMAQSLPKRRGRPPRNAVVQPQQQAMAQQSQPKRRGRPPKSGGEMAQQQQTVPKKKRVNSQRKGRRFEQEIARDLRQIYDPLELTDLIKDHSNLKHRGEPHQLPELLKASRVRRSDQGKGAMEPDLVVQDCPFWFELTDSLQPNGLKKLEQAEFDLSELNSSKKVYPIAIVHKSGSQNIDAWLRFSTLLYLNGFEDLTDSAANVIAVEQAPAAQMPVRIDYFDLLKALKTREDIRCAQ